MCSQRHLVPWCHSCQPDMWPQSAGPCRKRPSRYENRWPRHTSPRFQPHLNVSLPPTHNYDSSSFTTLPHLRLHRTPTLHLCLRDSSLRDPSSSTPRRPKAPVVTDRIPSYPEEKGHIFFLCLEPYYRSPSIHRSSLVFISASYA
jgi:hypothetical protein